MLPDTNTSIGPQGIYPGSKNQNIQAHLIEDFVRMFPISFIYESEAVLHHIGTLIGKTSLIWIGG